MDKIVKDLVKAITESNEKKQSAYDTTATVRRVEDGVAWVHIPGGVDETPVKLTVNASEGDEVQVRVGGGRAWIVGNATAPPTDDSTALYVGERVNKVIKNVEIVKELVADKATISDLEAAKARIGEFEDDISDAAKTATSYITDIDSNKGITIKPADSSGNDYLQMNSSAIEFYRNGLQKMYLSDSEFRLGRYASGEYNTQITSSAFNIRKYSTTLFSATVDSDLGGAVLTLGEYDKYYTQVTPNYMVIHDSVNGYEVAKIGTGSTNGTYYSYFNLNGNSIHMESYDINATSQFDILSSGRNFRIAASNANDTASLYLSGHYIYCESSRVYFPHNTYLYCEDSSGTYRDAIELNYTNNILAIGYGNYNVGQGGTAIYGQNVNIYTKNKFRINGNWPITYASANNTVSVSANNGTGMNVTAPAKNGYGCIGVASIQTSQGAQVSICGYWFTSGYNTNNTAAVLRVGLHNSSSSALSTKITVTFLYALVTMF